MIHCSIYTMISRKLTQKFKKIEADIKGISDAMSAGKKGYTLKYYDRYIEF